MDHASELVTLELHVSDAGRPAAGARIEIVHEPTAGPASPVRLLDADAEGNARLELAPGHVRAVAWRADSCALPVHAVLELGGGARLELALEPTYPVAGRVLAADTGRPVAGARVSFWTFAELDTVTTAADGTFRHPRFPARAPAQQLAVQAAGFGPEVRYLRLNADGSWKLSARTADESALAGSGLPWIELALVPEQRVTGIVQDAAGRPVAGAVVAAEGFFHALASVAVGDRRETTSDASGRFELEGLRSDIGHSLLAEAAGQGSWPLELAPGSGRVDAGVLRLRPRVTLVGTVLDLDGVPVVGGEVLARLVSQGPDAEGGIDTGARLRGREWRATTDEFGTFVLEGLAAGPLLLHAEDEDGQRAELALAPRVDGTFDAPCLTLASAPQVAQR